MRANHGRGSSMLQQQRQLDFMLVTRPQQAALLQAHDNLLAKLNIRARWQLCNRGMRHLPVIFSQSPFRYNTL